MGRDDPKDESGRNRCQGGGPARLPRLPGRQGEGPSRNVRFGPPKPATAAPRQREACLIEPGGRIAPGRTTPPTPSTSRAARRPRPSRAAAGNPKVREKPSERVETGSPPGSRGRV